MRLPASRYVFPVSVVTSSVDGLQCSKSKKGQQEDISNSNLGKEAISQAISALKNWQFNHAHHYQDIHNAQVQLHSDY
jgi:hypothetical protein